MLLTVKGDDIIISGIFSKVPDEVRSSWIRVDEIEKDFHLTGLKKTSVIKTEKITVPHRFLIKKEPGHLSQDLFKKVKKVLTKTLETE